MNSTSYLFVEMPISDTIMLIEIGYLNTRH